MIRTASLPTPTPNATPSFTTLPGSADPTPAIVLALALAGAVIATAVAGYLIYRATRSRSIVTPAYLFYAYFIAFVLIGVMWLFADRGNGSYVHFAGTRNYTLLFTVAAGILLFAAGVLIANRQARFDPAAELERRRVGSWSVVRPDRNTKVLFWFLAVLCLIACTILLTFGPVSPLVYLLTHWSQRSRGFDFALDYVRLAFLSPHAGGLPFQATLYQFYGNLLPLLGLLALGWSVLRRDRRWLIAGVALLGTTALMAAATLTKNPVENFLIFLFVAFLAFRMRDLAWREAVAVVVLAVGSFFAEVYLTNRGADLLFILQGGLRRLFVVQASVLYSTFEEFPARMGFLHGAGLLRDVVNLKPGPKSTLDFGGWLYTVIVTNQPGLGGVGSAPTAFFGQLYADFGVPGALIGMLVAGFGAQWAYIWFVRSPKTLVNWCVFVGLCTSIPRLATSSLVAIVFQYGVIASIMFGVYMAVGPRLLPRDSGGGGPDETQAPDPAEAAVVVAPANGGSLSNGHTESPSNGHAQPYVPSRYWQDVLSKSFNLSGSGLVGKSLAFNAWGYRTRRSAVMAVLGKAGTVRILDVGSGTGYWIGFWHHQGAAHVNGLDLTSVSVEKLKRAFPSDDIVVGDVTKEVPFEGPFELISVMDVLLHIVDEEAYRRALANLRRVARPGTRLLFMEPLTFGAPRPMIAGSHSRTRSIADVKAALQESGWKLERVRPATWLMSNPIEVQPAAGFWGMQAIWSAISLAARWEITGQIVGAIAYPIDQILCRLPWGPSSKVALAVAV